MADIKLDLPAPLGAETMYKVPLPIGLIPKLVLNKMSKY